MVLVSGEHYKELSGFLQKTTNNEAEMVAVLKALQAIKASNCDVTIYTDSGLVIGWVDKGWKCKKPHIIRVRNRIWKVAEQKGIDLSFKKIRGHSGDLNNDLADALAKSAWQGR